MRVTPNGSSEYHNGNEVGRYGRDISAGESYFVQYHDGIGGEPLWGMDKEVEKKISVSVDIILVADANNGLYAIDREAFSERVRTLDGREQCMMGEGNDAVTRVGDPNNHLHGHLWITPENAHGGYHKDKNEA